MLPLLISLISHPTKNFQFAKSSAFLDVHEDVNNILREWHLKPPKKPQFHKQESNPKAIVMPQLVYKLTLASKFPYLTLP